MSDDRTSAPQVSKDVDKDTSTTASEAQERIRSLRGRARMGAWGLAAFVIVSVLSIPNSFH